MAERRISKNRQKNKLTNTGKKNKLPIRGKLGVALCICILAYAIFNVIVGNTILKWNGKCMKAILVRETFGGKTSPHFGYKFIFNKKQYSGLVAEDGGLKIGDTVCIVYLESFPSINRPMNYYDSGQIKCNCGK